MPATLQVTYSSRQGTIIKTMQSYISRSPNGDHIERAIAALLLLVREQFGLEVVFLGEALEGRRYFRQISAASEPCVIEVGQSQPLEETLCQRILEGRAARLIIDVTSQRQALDLPPVYDGLGTHVGVPVYLASGRLYGFLCGFSFQRLEGISQRDIKRLEVAARTAARLIDEASQ